MPTPAKLLRNSMSRARKLLSQLKYAPAKDREKQSSANRWNLPDTSTSGTVIPTSYTISARIPMMTPPELNTVFILQKREGDELDNRHSKTLKELIATATSYSQGTHEKDVLVFDQSGWKKNTKLWESVQQSNWENVILDQALKASLKRDVEGFFDERANYEEFGVSWKRL